MLSDYKVEVAVLFSNKTWDTFSFVVPAATQDGAKLIAEEKCSNWCQTQKYDVDMVTTYSIKLHD